MTKQLIINADNFGISKESNRAILDGYNNGYLTSASLRTNGKAFAAATEEILPECPNLSIGIQLNLTQGCALTKNNLLTDKKNKFNSGFFSIRLKSYRKEYMDEVEKEFRCQIETVLSHTKIDNISSVNNIHLIPNIFNLVVKLAQEYNIPYVRTQFEELYFIPKLLKHLNLRYPINLIGLFIINHLSNKDKKLIQSANLKTNDYFIGSAYRNMMDCETVESGLEAIDNEKDCVVEISINPYINRNRKNNEFKITQDMKLKDSIERMGFELTNYKRIGQ